MDKITRIHIAKTPYEIGISAQESLKEYLDEIRSKLDSDLEDEVMADIELRITELLAERKVNRNDVITTKDVQAIKEQLGSPEQFTDGENSDKAQDDSSKESRKLLRDTDNEIIGGVASGIALYLGMDTVIVRIIFVILTFISGLGIVLYLLLWILVPRAKSSSDQLKMSGQPVNVSTLQKYRESASKRLGNSPSVLRAIILKIFRIVVTAFGVLASLHILAVLAIATGFTYVYPFRSIFTSFKLDYLLFGLIWLIGLSMIGLIVTLIIRVWGKPSARLKVSAISGLSALVVAIAGTAAVSLIVFNHFSDEYGNGKITTALAVNNETPNKASSQLVVTGSSDLDLTYVVTSQPIHATYQAYPGLSKPNLDITNNKGTITVYSASLADAAPRCLGNLCRHIYLPIRATIYGPSIKNIYVNNGSNLIINNADINSELAINASNWSNVSVNQSYLSSTNISAVNNSIVDLDSSSAGSANIFVDSTSNVQAPSTNDLTANVPDNCNSFGNQVLSLNNYPGLKTIFNGHRVMPKDLYQKACLSLPGPPPTPQTP